MNINQSHNNITIKISFSDIKNEAEKLFNKSVSDQMIKLIMDEIGTEIVNTNSISTTMITDIILKYKDNKE